MDLKMIKGGAVLSAFVALSSVAMGTGGCGEEDKASDKSDAGGNNGNPDGDGGGTGGGTFDAAFTLVPILAVDASSPIVTPHKVVVLDGDTGKPLDPSIETTTASGTGKFTLKGLPKDKKISIYVQGVGPADTASSTYDTVLVNFNPKAGDPLFRISSAGTFSLAAGAGGFTAKDDRAALSGAIYWAPEGPRKGTVGCAKLCIDGKAPVADVDVRYVASGGLPTTPANQQQTIRSGRFYVGNLTEGAHTIAPSLDDCKTTLGEEVEFFVPFSRAEAKSPLKAVLLQLGIDLEVAANPTPKSCPAD